MRGEGHLTKSRQYALVYSGGSSWVSNLVVLRALPNGLSLSRYGISVSKRVGKAVVRNRVKRLLRESMRVKHIKPGWDVVLVARAASAGASYVNLDKSVNGLLTRAGLLARENE